MKLNKNDYNSLIEEYPHIKPTQKNCSVSLCQINQTGFLEFNGKLTLNTKFENVDIYYIDGSEFFITKDNKALFIIEAIAFNNIDDFIEYILDIGDVEESKIDTNIKKSKADWYVTSNENIIY